MLIFRFLKNTRGFTVTELLLVTSLLSSIPVSSYVGARNKALQIECLSNFRTPDIGGCSRRKVGGIA
ncbi:MAG: hypothetical protein Q7J40_04035 [Atribacterota bacterium]|nr:hypothetical protein [Atribacterota bacterium]